MSKDNEFIDEEVKQKKKKSGLSRFFSILVDILIVPIIVIAFACTILTFSAKANNRVPQIFGMSIVTVLSDSMEPNYKKGDVLIIKNVDTKNLKAGDNIAFYSAKNGHWTDNEGNSAVVFHQVVRVMQIEGKPYFACMGTNVNFDYNNESNFTFVGQGQGEWSRRAIEGNKYEYYIKDGGEYIINLIGYKQDPGLSDINGNKVDDDKMQVVSAVDVVGIYDSGLSPILGGFINFSASSTGMLCLVIAPSALLILLTIFNLRKEIKQAKEEEEKEREVLEGNISKLKETSSKVKQEKEGKKESTKEQKSEDKKEQEQEIKKEDKEVNIDNVISSVAKNEKSKDDKTVSAKEDMAEKTIEKADSIKEEKAEKTDIKLDDKKQTKTHKKQPKDSVNEDKKVDIVEQKVEDKKEVEQKVKQPASAKKTAPKKVAPTKEVIAESAETKLESKTEKSVSEAKPITAPKKVAPTKVPASKPDSVQDVKAETKTSEAKPKTAPKKVAPVKATEPKTEVKSEAKAETPKKVAPKKVAPPKND